MPKVVRTRPRAPRRVKVSKRRTGTRNLDIAPELHAPITGDIERQLVAKFDEKEVLKALDPFVTKCKWNDGQCVANAIRRTGRGDVSCVPGYSTGIDRELPVRTGLTFALEGADDDTDDP